MNRRSVAWVIAVPSLVVLWLVTVFAPLPFVTYQPGLTENLLGDYEGKPVIEVAGHKVYRDSGEMRLTTIYVTGPESRVSLWTLMQAWASEDDAIYPYEVQYPTVTTTKQDRAESQQMMTDSKRVAIANALTALGEEVDAVAIQSIDNGSPADGKLQAGDVIDTINSEQVRDPDRAVALIKKAGVGSTIVFGVRRDDKPVTVKVTPKNVNGTPKIGVSLGLGYLFPFQVNINMDEQIGGPSAGLMFSLAIYDTLTPGSLTGGATIAGTGTAELDGKVGSIGGIQQKISAAYDEGAKLFFVPPDNCSDAVDSAHADDLRLVRADTMQSAVDSLKKWVKNPDAKLPSCAS